MIDRRKHERYRLSIPVAGIILLDGVRANCNLLDISLGGVYCLVERGAENDVFKAIEASIKAGGRPESRLRFPTAGSGRPDFEIHVELNRVECVHDGLEVAGHFLDCGINIEEAIDWFINHGFVMRSKAIILEAREAISA